MFEKSCLCVIILLKSGSVVDMEQAKSLYLLINVELRGHRYHRAGILDRLYAEVAGLMEKTGPSFTGSVC